MQPFFARVLFAIAVLCVPLFGQRNVVSVDVLRQPLPAKAQAMIQQAVQEMNQGNHASAIALLWDTLGKYPVSAGRVYSLLGVEFLKTDQFVEAVQSLEQAVVLMPHDAMNRSNLGLVLACQGDYQRAAVEVRRALAMDPRNERMKGLLEAIEQLGGQRETLSSSLPASGL